MSSDCPDLRIVYDHSIFMVPRTGGVLRHVLELVRGIHALPEASGVAIDVEAGLYHAPVAAADLPPDTLHGVKVPRFRGSGRLLSLINRVRLRHKMKNVREPAVILHETFYGNAVPLPRRIKRVVVVHDTIWEDSANRSAHATELKNKANSIASADGIIFVSAATRAGFDRHYPPPKMAAVIHHGCELRCSRERRGPAVPGPFILYVGQRRNYKNWNRFAAAFGQSPLSRTHWLVSFGQPPTDEERGFVEADAAGQRLLWRGGSDDDLADLYAAADCFVYPSEAEGFGIPLVEAAKLGCPVACSDIPPFREVLGEHARFFDPRDEHAIVEAVTAAVHGGRGAAVVEAARAACDRYTWRNAAKHTLDFYRRVAGVAP